MRNLAINNETTEVLRPLPFLTLTPSNKEMIAMAKSRIANKDKICQVEGCRVKTLAVGYCQRHYAQVRKHGRVSLRTIHDPNEFVFKGDDCVIYIYNRNCKKIAETVIDIDDFQIVKDFKWCLGAYGYVCSGSGGRKKILSRYLMEPIPDGLEIDHADRDILNNRRSTNLRYASISDNKANSFRSDNTSGYKGVIFNKRLGKWSAAVQRHRTPYFLGLFISKEDAALAYNQKALELFGEFAVLNELGGAR